MYLIFKNSVVSACEGNLICFSCPKEGAEAYLPILTHRFCTGIYNVYMNYWSYNDLIQACGKIPVSISELDIDYLSIAGQKVRLNLPRGMLKMFSIVLWSQDGGIVCTRFGKQNCTALSFDLWGGPRKGLQIRVCHFCVQEYQLLQNFLTTALRIQLTWQDWAR